MARKQLLPYMPCVIGVVTSPTGAVIRDIIHRISDRFPLHVLVWPVRVQGDAASLTVLVRNLVDNAVRHSPPGGRVEVRIVPGDGTPTLTVDDAGPGIPAEDRERVFDRFVRRADAAGEGSGLGLAIVRKVAERHGAGVELSTSPLGGLRASVRFGP
ncbi:MAG: hypothetical protein ABT20_12260 [Rubrivivax sp. SCN 70-15]|nr:MAG: hypothetical protein ABT20_12260 [Rubrivivax sp. SCN 70-15]